MSEAGSKRSETVPLRRQYGATDGTKAGKSSNQRSAEGTECESPARQCRGGPAKESESPRDGTHPEDRLRFKRRPRLLVIHATFARSCHSEPVPGGSWRSKPTLLFPRFCP